MFEMFAKFGAIWEKYGPTVLGSVASQLVMAISLILMNSAFGARDSDSYAVGIQVGYASLSTYVLGFVYMIALGRPNYSKWQSSKLTASFASVIAGGAGASAIFFSKYGMSQGYLAVIVFFTIGGAFLAIDGVSRVRLACEGRPEPLARVTLYPNIGFLVSVLLHLFNWFDFEVWMASAIWASVALLQLVSGIFRRGYELKAASLDHLKSDQIDVSDKKQVVGLAIGLATTAIFPIFYSSALIGLAPGLASYGLLVMKTLTAVVSVFGNAILLVNVNWVNLISAVSKPIRVAAALGTIFAGLGMFLALIEIESIAQVMLLLAFCPMAISSSFLLREVNALRLGRVVLTKTLVDLFLTGLATIQLVSSPTLLAYFGIFLLNQGVTVAIAAGGLREKWMMRLGWTCTAISLIFVFAR